MFTVILVLAVFALGFGAGRVKHPSNLSLSMVKEEVRKIEQEALTLVNEDKSKVLAVVARLKSLL